MNQAELRAKLDAYSDAEKLAGALMFMGVPDRWYEPMHFRCINEHISTMYLKSEAARANLCLECGEPVELTFPEDKDGPLP